MPTTFIEHTAMSLRRAFRDFDIGRDMLYGACIAALTLTLQVWWRLIPLKDWEEHKWQWVISFISPFILVIGGHSIWRIVSAPWRVHQDQEKQISDLEAFRKSVEDSVVSLSLARHEVKMVPFGTLHPRTGAFMTVEGAECMYLI